MKIIILVTTIAAAISVLPAASYGQLVNGGFELPQAASGGSLSYFAGSTAITGWTVLGSSGVSLINTNKSELDNGMDAFNAFEGTQSLDLTGINDDNHPTLLSSGVTQDVTTIPGITYTLTFYLGRACGTASIYSTPAMADLSIDGGALVAFTNSNLTPGYVNWKGFTYEFMATGATTAFTFMNGTTSNNYDGLDGVQLLTPEPPANSLILLATVSITCIGLKHKHAQRPSQSTPVA